MKQFIGQKKFYNSVNPKEFYNSKEFYHFLKSSIIQNSVNPTKKIYDRWNTK